MDISGPSGIKKRKVEVKNPKNLTNEEMLRILEEEDFSEFEDNDSDDSYVAVEDESPSEDESSSVDESKFQALFCCIC